MDFPPQVRRKAVPVCLNSIGDVIVFAPIGDHGGINIASLAAEHFHGATALSARRKDPVKGLQLSAIIAQDGLKLGELLHCRQDFSVISNDGNRRAVCVVKQVGMRSVEIDGAEVMK